MIKPAIRHLTLYAAENYGMGFLFYHFDSLYTVLIGLLQWKCLSTHGGTIMETLYGLHRVQSSSGTPFAILRSTASATTRQGTSRRVMPYLHLQLSLAYVILVPSILNFLRDLSRKLRERAIFRARRSAREETVAAALAAESTGAATGAGADSEMIRDGEGVISRLNSYLQRQLSVCAEVGAQMFPFLELAGDTAVVMFNIMYLCRITDTHHPMLALLGLTLQKGPGTGTGTGVESGVGLSSAGHLQGDQCIYASSMSSSMTGSGNISSNASGNGLNFTMSAIVAVVFALRAAEWLHNHSSSSSTPTLTERLAPPVELPPAPKPTKVGRGCIYPPQDHTLCPICGQKRVNACASTGGYVFCYLCLLEYIREHGNTCPVTALACAEKDIIRLYEPEVAS